MDKKLISLVIPVYNEHEVLAESYRQMSAVMEKLPYDYEIIYIDDGSKDGSLEILRGLCAKDSRVRVRGFSRNFGHQPAVTAGMDIAKGDALIIIDVDLQDPPEVIPQLIEKWEQGAEIVYGKRKKREGESLFKKLTAFVYYRLLTSMSAYPIPLDTGDFRLIDRKVADMFLVMRERNRFLRGMSAWMGFKTEPVEYIRNARFAGSTKYTFKKMLKLATDGILGFSYKPMAIPGYIGALICALSLAGTAALIILEIIGGVAPWLWAVCGIAFINGITLMSLGIMGAYMNRMYEELKDRPIYIVRENINVDKEVKN